MGCLAEFGDDMRPMGLALGFLSAVLVLGNIPGLVLICIIRDFLPGRAFGMYWRSPLDKGLWACCHCGVSLHLAIMRPKEFFKSKAVTGNI